jgi:TonB-linked SusC/RagA family outer membrane protein
MRSKFKWIFTLVLAFLVQFSFAQERTITGVVTENGMPLPGATVVIKGTKTGTQADFDGKYTIKAKQGDVLEFSYVGMKTKTATVGASNTVSAAMEADNTLDEVIVTSYSAKGKSLLSSAISKVSAEDIKSLAPTTTLDNMLQGKAAGVSVVASNGRPGGNAFLRIRGISSLSGAGNVPLYVVDGTIVNEVNVNAIPPSDVEDVTVLKDPATTAQYGSRASAGVVIITTKRGKRNREATVTVSSRYGYTEEIPFRFTMMTPAQKLQYEKELGTIGLPAATALPGFTSTPQQLQTLIDRSPDWNTLLTRDGENRSASFNISGGGKEFDYNFSASTDRDNGSLNNVFGFERINFRGAVNYSAKKWLDTGFTISHTRNINDGTRDRNNAQNPFRARFDTAPYQTVYQQDANGNVLFDAEGKPLWNWTNTQLNPIEYVVTNLDKQIENVTLGSFFSKIKFSDRLSYTFRVGVTSTNRVNETYALPGNRLDQLIGDPAFPGLKTDANNRRVDYTITNLLNYNYKGEKHNFSFSALQEYNELELNSMFIRSSGYANSNLSTVINAGRIDAANTGRAQTALLSYGFFGSYDYKQRYIVDFSARADGSSVFGKNTRWGYFYSGSAAWNIAKESFFKIKSVDNLKLRASYGITGQSRALGFYASIPTVAFTPGLPGGQSTGISEPGNPDLAWEEQKQLNIGLEFGLFNSRLRGSVDYFQKETENLLNRIISPDETDLPNLPSNIGSIRNKGIELELSGDLIRKENFKWTLGGNVTFLDTKVLSTYKGIDVPYGFNLNLQEGAQIGEYYLIEWGGVDSQTGRPQYIGADGNTYFQQTLPAGNNRVMTGKTPLPTFEGGIFTSFDYKGWGLRADLFFRGGNYIYNQVRANLNSDGRAVLGNQAVDAFNYWKNPGDTNVLPNPLFQAETGLASTRWLEKGDFMRLRSLEFSYTFQQNILKRLPISNLRLFVQGQNLFTITDFYGDPEVGISSGETISQAATVFPGELTLYSYPTRRIFTFGIEIAF